MRLLACRSSSCTTFTSSLFFVRRVVYVCLLFRGRNSRHYADLRIMPGEWRMKPPMPIYKGFCLHLSELSPGIVSGFWWLQILEECQQLVPGLVATRLPSGGVVFAKIASFRARFASR